MTHLINHVDLIKQRADAYDSTTSLLVNSLLSQHWLIWPASLDRKHHHWKGGLAQHTHEVVVLCHINGAFFSLSQQDQRALFLAAAFHDSGKLWDYEYVPERTDGSARTPEQWIASPHKRLIHHISRSALCWSHTCNQVCPDEEALHDQVLHAILSHHGRREWGSPVAPFTKVAWLLHLCDGMSARMDDCERVDMVKVDQGHIGS